MKHSLALLRHGNAVTYKQQGTSWKGTAMNYQSIGLAFIVVTICLSFFASVILSALKMPVEGTLQGVINTAFTAVAAGIPTWLLTQKAEEAKGAAVTANLRADYQASLAQVKELTKGE
jgi:hypothetical protein